MQRNVERSYSLCPWFLFYDQAIAPSWYNFKTKDLRRADPNNLMDPPPDEEGGEDDDKDGGGGGQLSVEGGYVHGYGGRAHSHLGAQLLKDSHTAEVTAKGTLFDLQPPVEREASLLLALLLLCLQLCT